MISAGYPQRMRPPPSAMRSALVQQGRLGQKSGAGFYDYDAARRQAEAQRFAHGARPGRAAAEAPQGRRWGRGDRRTHDARAGAGSDRCLEEGVVGSAARADMADAAGRRFPAYLGGR
jgi:3-hydroxyacyl-CoA dehydrogenase